MYKFRWGRRLRGDEKGATLVETLMALAILSLICFAFVGAMGTLAKATFIADEQATAESLVRGELEYVKNCNYQYGAAEYPVDPLLTIPEGWVVFPPVVEPLHGTDDGIQKVTVKVKHSGKVVLTVEDYKVNR